MPKNLTTSVAANYSEFKADTSLNKFLLLFGKIKGIIS